MFWFRPRVPERRELATSALILSQRLLQHGYIMMWPSCGKAFGWLVGWLVEATHGSSHSPSRQISGSAPKTSSQTLPASFWWSVKRKPDQKEQNPMTASQKPPSHTQQVHFFKKPRRCQTRIHTSSSSARDKASRAPRTATIPGPPPSYEGGGPGLTATSPKSSVGIAAGFELGPTPSSPKTCSTRPRSANAGCITVAAPVRYMCKLNIWGKEDKVGEKEDLFLHKTRINWDWLYIGGGSFNVKLTSI